MNQNEFDLSQTIGFALHHASYLLKTSLKSEFNRAGFQATPEEFVMLNLIPQNGIDQSELREQSLKDKTNVTRLLDRLAKKGWVKRSESKQSRRQQLIELTSQGKKKQLQLREIAKQVVAKAIDGINQDDIETARLTLLKITKNLL